MNSFTEAINAYQEMSIWLKPSANCIECIKRLEEQPKKTGIGKRIVAFYIFIIVFFMCIVPVTAYAIIYVSDELYEKLKDAELSREEMGEIQENLQNWGFTSEDVLRLEGVSRNEEGLTYGPDALGADLIAVISDQGEKGYIYRSEFENSDRKILEGVSEKREEGKTLKVYQSDGKTVIGTFTLSNGKQGE